MAQIAFYAPLKSPNHPTPSGEREIARNLMTMLADGGLHDVQLVSELRSRCRDGSAETQARLMAQAEAEVARLTSVLASSQPDIWVTYHNYYKAPDLLGPAVARALRIPYVIVEASRAKSRLTGPWAPFAQLAEAACDAADVIYYVVALDELTLSRDKTATQTLVHFRPFLPQSHLPPETTRTPGRILSVGMLRQGDKLGSYQLIAETLTQLGGTNWQLDIAGDGPARPEVEALMAPFADHVRFLGQLDRSAVSQAYQSASVFLWPGYNEAYGMVYLEAQASGLPVVAQDRDGVRDVLAPGRYPPPASGAPALAALLQSYLDQPDHARQIGRAARAHVARHHLIQPARDTFWSAAQPLLEKDQ